jgi:hypothetical protein
MSKTGDLVGHDNNIIKAGVPKDPAAVQEKDGRPLTGCAFIYLENPPPVMTSELQISSTSNHPRRPPQQRVI